MIELLIILPFFISVMLIWKGSDWITDSLIPVADYLGTGYIALTTILVSILLSVPELFTALYSYAFGHINVGVGVLIGSVMINIGLTVGLSASIKPLQVEKSVVIRDGIFLIFVALIVLVFGSNLYYSQSEGLVLVLMFIPYALNVWYFESSKPKKLRKQKVKDLE